MQVRAQGVCWSKSNATYRSIWNFTLFCSPLSWLFRHWPDYLSEANIRVSLLLAQTLESLSQHPNHTASASTLSSRFDRPLHGVCPWPDKICSQNDRQGRALSPRLSNPVHYADDDSSEQEPPTKFSTYIRTRLWWDLQQVRINTSLCFPRSGHDLLFYWLGIFSHL